MQYQQDLQSNAFSVKTIQLFPLLPNFNFNGAGIREYSHRKSSKFKIFGINLPLEGELFHKFLRNFK